MKTKSLLLYFILSFFMEETLLRASTTGGVLSMGLLFTLIFSVSFGIVFYFFLTLFKAKVCYILSSILLGFSALTFSSQMIYYKFFKTFYTLYSAGNGGQVLQFWKDILNSVFKNSIWIIIFFLPLILILAFGKKFLSFERINSSFRVFLVYCLLFTHIAGLVAVCMGGQDEFSAYDLYFKDSNLNPSIQKLGLLTTMRLDLQKQTLGWSSVANASSPVQAEPSTPPSNENNNENKKVEYNVMNIDFSELISSEKNNVIKDMHQYFQNVQPTAKNDYTGKYKGYNLIFITAESFSPYAVREDLTPTLYKMVHQGYNFTNFYNPIWGVSTSDGEYVACTGLIPKSGVWSFEKSGSNYMPFAMGNQLNAIGYKTVAYHDHTYTYYKRNISHPNMGYDYKGVGHGLDMKKTWPESDLEMMQKTVPEYINNQPFHAYYMTVSGHLNYTFAGNAMASKNKSYVKDLPYSEPPKAYIAAQIELDKAMENLLSQLEQAGIADKTLIALSPDHYPYGLNDSALNELAGHNVEKNFELYKSSFILYTEGMKPKTIDKPCSSLDIIPTLSNLLGLEYDSRLLMGRDIFSDSSPLVIFLNKSFITDKGSYNSQTKKFTPVPGAEVDDNYVKTISSIVNSKFYYSAKILDTNYYKKVLK